MSSVSIRHRERASPRASEGRDLRDAAGAQRVAGARAPVRRSLAEPRARAKSSPPSSRRRRREGLVGRAASVAGSRGSVVVVGRRLTLDSQRRARARLLDRRIAMRPTDATFQPAAGHIFDAQTLTLDSRLAPRNCSRTARRPRCRCRASWWCRRPESRAHSHQELEQVGHLRTLSPRGGGKPLGSAVDPAPFGVTRRKPIHSP